MPAAAKVRLHVAHPVGEGQTVPLDRDQAHYLFGVMRMGVGDRLFVFDQTSGEWLAEVAEAGKRGGALRCLEQTAPRREPADVWLLFAPIKKERTDFIVEKATELGAAVIQPVRTAFTNSERVKVERLRAHAVEATEQCGGTVVPEVRDMVGLDEALAALPGDRALMFCDEALAGGAHGLPEGARGSWAILIGPEGGFSEAERARLRDRPGAHAVSLGPRILRADTAAVAALTLWQTRFGDWR
jgi:16S rRNA (uracil1498-N3)-methyltransferase